MSNNRIFQLISRKLTQEITNAELEEMSKLDLKNINLNYLEPLLVNYWDYKPKNDKDFLMASYLLHKQRREKKSTKQFFNIKRKLLIPISILCLSGLILFVFLFNLKNNSHKNLAKTISITVPFGQKKQIELPDHSKVWLNANSTLTYNKNFIKNRRVKLSGEAYFKVTENKKYPFIVHTSELKITALGTEFNVKNYQTDAIVEATLINGKVEINLNDLKENVIVLKPNEKFVLKKSLYKENTFSSTSNKTNDKPVKILNFSIENINEISPIIPEQNNLEESQNFNETNWTKDKIFFENENVEIVLKKIEKWYGVTFVFTNEKTKTIQVYATVNNLNLESILKALEYSLGIKFTIKNDFIYVS